MSPPPPIFLASENDPAALNLKITEVAKQKIAFLNQHAKAVWSEVKKCRADMLEGESVNGFDFSGHRFICSRTHVWLELSDQQIGKGTSFTARVGLDILNGRTIVIKEANPTERAQRNAKRHIEKTAQFSPGAPYAMHDLENGSFQSPRSKRHVTVVLQEHAPDLLKIMLNGGLKTGEERVQAIVDIANSINYLHNNKHQVNGDIKLINIGFKGDGIYVVADNDTLCSPNNPSFQQRPRGTIPYLAPEVLCRQREVQAGQKPWTSTVGYGVDLWSFGIVILQIYRINPPWYLTWKTMEDVENAIPEFVRNQTYRQGMPEELYPLLDGLFKIDPKERITISRAIEILAHIQNPSQVPLPEGDQTLPLPPTENIDDQFTTDDQPA
ncbi:MAG: protein kinase [Chlamydiia bacterium]|nr:protein kinase [Chlamydiia bacterium]